MEDKVKMRAVYNHAWEILKVAGAVEIMSVYKDGNLIYLVGLFPFDSLEITPDAGPQSVVQYNLDDDSYELISYAWLVIACGKREVKDITEEFMNCIAE